MSLPTFNLHLQHQQLPPPQLQQQLPTLLLPLQLPSLQLQQLEPILVATMPTHKNYLALTKTGAETAQPSKHYSV